jgi:hypothetical protein
VAQPYSLIFGHVPLLLRLNKNYPKDAKPINAYTDIVLNWQQYFPGAKQCPPVLYLDLAPFAAPMAMAVDPSLITQFTQDSPQPRHSTMRWALTPVTGGLDIVSATFPNHRIWRAKLNPGFSLKNIMELLPFIIEECVTFRDTLVKSAGADKEWGTDVFPMVDKLTDLTFSVICRVALWVSLFAFIRPFFLILGSKWCSGVDLSTTTLTRRVQRFLDRRPGPGLKSSRTSSSTRCITE